MKKILVVIAHNKVLTLANYLKENNWSKHFDDIRFVSPNDEPIIGENFYSLGKSEHHGIHSINRMLFALEKLYESSEDGDLLCLTEYDVFFTSNFEPNIGLDEFSGTRFINADPRFTSMYYYHGPWVFGRQAIKNILEHLNKQDMQLGFPDRWLGNVVDHLKFKEVKSYSQNSLDNLQHQDEAVFSIEKGAQFIHGIKNIAMVHALLYADMPSFNEEQK